MAGKGIGGRPLIRLFVKTSPPPREGGFFSFYGVAAFSGNPIKSEDKHSQFFRYKSGRGRIWSGQTTLPCASFNVGVMQRRKVKRISGRPLIRLFVKTSPSSRKREDLERRKGLSTDKGAENQ